MVSFIFNNWSDKTVVVMREQAVCFLFCFFLGQYQLLVTFTWLVKVNLHFHYIYNKRTQALEGNFKMQSNHVGPQSRYHQTLRVSLGLLFVYMVVDNSEVLYSAMSICCYFIHPLQHQLHQIIKKKGLPFFSCSICYTAVDLLS